MSRFIGSFGASLVGLVCAALVAVLLCNCSLKPIGVEQERVPVTAVPLSVLPSSPTDMVGAVRLIDWAKAHTLVPAVANPEKECTQMGPPMCMDVYQGLDWCRNACGDAYWHLENTNTCIAVMTGEVVSCP